MSPVCVFHLRYITYSTGDGIIYLKVPYIMDALVDVFMDSGVVCLRSVQLPR